MNQTQITEKLAAQNAEFRALALAKAAQGDAANKLMTARAAWIKCHTANSCADFLNLPDIAAAGHEYQRHEYFTAHPEKTAAFIPAYVNSHPELLNNNLLQNNLKSEFVMKASQHLSNHVDAYVAGTTILIFMCAVALRKLNPFRFCFNKAIAKDQPQSKSAIVRKLKPSSSEV